MHIRDLIGFEIGWYIHGYVILAPMQQFTCGIVHVPSDAQYVIVNARILNIQPA